jgi:ribonuclease VapC
MIVDSSAIVAMLRREPEARDMFAVMTEEGSGSISAANYFEAAIVVDGQRDPVMSSKLDALLQRLNVEIAPVTASQAKIARQAYRDFGKGSGHKARLNFGDCFAYALAAESGEPLLFKGNDFVEAGLTRLV